MILLGKHQVDALDKIRTGCIIHGGTGSGKSRTALVYYYTQHGGKFRVIDDDHVELTDKMKNPRDLYIITTAKKRDTYEWEGEMTPFLLTPNDEDKVYNHKVVIDSWNNIKKYKDVRGAFFIFDEQRVVGSGAWVKAFLRITRFNPWILLSATPGDTWSDYIPVFIANGFYRNRTDFKDQHIVMKPFTKFPQIDRYLNTGRLIRLRNRILVDMDFLRETEQHHEFIFTDFDRMAYKNVARSRWNPYQNKPIETPGEFCQCLRRMVSDTDSRQLAMLELFEKHPKLIVFYNFDYEREILLNLGYGDGVEIAEWSGHKHQPVPDGNKWVYLVQYNAGAEGWNCITTDTIIFYSENYSYKMMEQAAGRIDRMNTKFTDLWYYHLTSKSSIELAIRRALVEKKRFNETKFACQWKGF
ncbi:MAG: DEAD/DEAH box helicase family protein [Clostridiales bacterium]|nr:DEAD/DEAH box helicase family protein [Clostridiales bacterium]